jgi:exodeoxyribonuclease V gamma subunit
MAHRTGDPATTDVALEVDGRRLTGRVPDRHGDLLVRVTYSSLKGTQALALWLDLLAVQAAEPETEVRGIVIAKNGQGRIGPVDPDLARSTLAAWTAIRHEGLRRLCHLPLETGRAWAKAGDDRFGARKGARSKWEWDRFKPERADPAWCYLLGANAPLDRLTDLAVLAEQTWRDVLPYERGWR